MTTASSLAPDHSAHTSTVDALPPLHVVDPDPPRTHDVLVEQLIEDHLEVARSIASRYRNRGIDADDLRQVALLGLTKAAHRFDPGAGHDFMAFAVPTIRGEVRRYFRDTGWVVRPPRRVQELQARIKAAQDDLEQLLGRSPRPTEVATHLDVDVDDVVEALSVDGCFSPTSLDSPLEGAAATIGDLIGDDTTATDALEAKIVLEPLISGLDPRDRRIVFMRFYEERSQQEIADAVGLTQAQVSRVLRRILTELRVELEAGPGQARESQRTVARSTRGSSGPANPAPAFRRGA
ncbi:SigB/SigF/SigG family RNA polymerase sigma factor [Alloalcanivorax gelatiniphagus]